MAEWQLYQSPGQQQGAAPPAPPPPRQPRKNPYRDGQSTSAQYYDLFEMIRHPNAAKDNRPPDPPPRPLVPLTKQQRLEKEIEKKFRKQARQAFLASFVKFLFFVFILPPYVLLYRLPKLLLVDWIVALSNYIDNKLIAMCKAIRRAYESFKQRIRASLLSFWQLIKATFQRKMGRTAQNDDEPMSFLAFLAEGIVALYRYTIYPLIRAAQKSWRLSKKIARAIRDFPSQLHQKIQKSLKRYHQWRDRLLNRAKTKLLNAIENLKERTTRRLSRWIDAKILQIRDLFLRLYARLKQSLKALAFAFRHPVQTYHWIRKTLSTSFQKGKNSFLAYVKAHREALQHRWQQLLADIDRRFLAPFRAWRDRLKAKVQTLVRWFKSPYQHTRKAFRDLVLKLKKALSSRLDPFKQALQERFRKLIAPFKAVYEMFKKRYADLKARLNKRLERFNAALITLGTPFVWAGRQIWSQLKPLAAPFIRFYHHAGRFIAASVLFVRRAIAWVHVLYRYGMELVRGTAEKSFGLR